MRPTSAHGHMVVTGCNQSLTGTNAIAIVRFLHLDQTYPVQSVRESGGENLGHMLHRHNGGAICRHRSENLCQCFSPSSRSPYGNETVGGNSARGALYP